MLVCDRHTPRTIMHVVKNGEPFELDEHSKVYGDVYKCPLCGNQVLGNFGEAQPWWKEVKQSEAVSK